MRSFTAVSLALAVGLAGGCQSSNIEEASSAVGVDGAIFTTLVDGTRVNANIYNNKEDVYLDGGPGDNAPAKAAALPDGEYCFQVTDPSGKVLLSTDAIGDRQFTINDGLITDSSGHDTGDDADHDALTVQLYPYLDTPNPGGEYKVWVSLCENLGDEDSRFHGFIPRYSKTDNFKVRELVVAPPPEPYCGDGNLDAGEQCDDGNNVDGDGCQADCTLPPAPPCCGDGHVDAGEQCDDGNNVDGDGCQADCTLPPPPPPPPCCGDGNVDAGEQCDDGNTVDGDGCSATCTLEEKPPCPAPEA